MRWNPVTLTLVTVTIVYPISITVDARIAQPELTNVLTRRDFDTIPDQWSQPNAGTNGLVNFPFIHHGYML